MTLCRNTQDLALWRKGIHLAGAFHTVGFPVSSHPGGFPVESPEMSLLVRTEIMHDARKRSQSMEALELATLGLDGIFELQYL